MPGEEELKLKQIKKESPKQPPEKEKVPPEGEKTREAKEILEEEVKEKAEKALAEIQGITREIQKEIEEAEASFGKSEKLEEIQARVEKIAKESLNQICEQLKGVLPETKIKEILESVAKELEERRKEIGEKREKTPEELEEERREKEQLLKEVEQREEILTLEDFKRMPNESLETLVISFRQKIRDLEKRWKESTYKNEKIVLEDKIVEFENKLVAVEKILYQRRLAQEAEAKIKKIDEEIKNLKEQIKEGDKKLQQVKGPEFDKLNQKLKDLEEKIHDLEKQKQGIQKETEEKIKTIDEELREREIPPILKEAPKPVAETRGGAPEKPGVEVEEEKPGVKIEAGAEVPPEQPPKEKRAAGGEAPPSPEAKLRRPSEDETKILMNIAKIEASYLPEEAKKELLEKVRFVDSRNISKEQKENIDKLIGQLLKIGKDVDLKEKDAIISALSENLGLSQEKLNQIYLDQLNKLEVLSQQRYDSKEKGWKKWGKVFGKIAIYAGAGTTISFFTGGVAAGAVVAGARVLENWFAGKKREKELLQAKEEMRAFLSSDSEESKTFKEEMYKDLIAQLAVAKQEEIDLKTKVERPDLDLLKNEEAYLKDPSEANRKKVEQALNTLQIDQANSIYNYLKERNKNLSEAEKLTDEEIEERVKLVKNMLALEKGNELIGLDFRLKNKGFIEKLAEKLPSLPVALDKIRNFWIKIGGTKTSERLVSTGVYGVAGVLARSCPGLRRVLFGVAGAKLGETGADLIIAKASRYEILRAVQARMLEQATDLANFPDDLLTRAKTQLLDKGFAQSNPEEYARLKEAVFEIELAKTKHSEEFLKKANQDLEKTIAEKLKIKKESKAVKAGMMIGGALLGILGGEALTEYLSERAAHAKEEALAEQKPWESGAATKGTLAWEFRPEEAAPVVPPETPPTGPIIETAKPGDNVWRMIERAVDEQIKSGKLDLGTQDPAKLEAYKTYLIDAIKDKVALNPSEYGLPPSLNLIHPGDQLDLTGILRDQEFIEKTLDHIHNLSPENVHNILVNNEFLREIHSLPPSEISDTNLMKALEIEGGPDQASPGLVNEHARRIVEVGSAIEYGKAFISSVTEQLREQEDFLNETSNELQKAHAELAKLSQETSGFWGAIKEFFNIGDVQGKKAELQEIIHALSNRQKGVYDGCRVFYFGLRVAVGQLNTEVDRFETLTGQSQDDLRVIIEQSNLRSLETMDRLSKVLSGAK